MRNPELLCLGCMEELSHPNETCRKCGFNRIEYEENRNVHTLPSYTILAGKYLLGKVLGEGGFGITYIAWDLNRECRVAVKEYFPSGLATRDTRFGDGEALTIMPGEKAAYYQNGLKNFAEEGRNLARFQHLPGIVSVRDFFQDNETAYIVMDYVEGKNLKQYLREHYDKNGEHTPMEEKQILEMMQPVLQALSEIHKVGIIHRDISPENIICGPDGKITLIDFGAARTATGTETKSLTIMLKHGYAPEEQYRTHGKQGPWTDIYAICATMYQMASGQLPMESIERMREDNLQPLRRVNPKVSEEFSDVIQKGMEVWGEKRYQSVEEMQEILYPKPVVEKVSAAEDVVADESTVEPLTMERTIDEEKTDEKIEKEKNKKIFRNMFVLVIVIVLLAIGIKVAIPKTQKQQFSEVTVSEEGVQKSVDEQLAKDIADQEEKVFENVMVSDISLTEEKYVIAVGDPALRSQMDFVNKVIDIMQNEGTLKQICNDYFADGIREPIASKELDDREHQLVVATIADYVPFEYIEDEKYYGVDLEIALWLTAALGRGDELVIQNTTFDNVISNVESGECDIAISAISADKEQSENVVYSNSYFDASKCVAVRKNDLTFEAYEINDSGMVLKLCFGSARGMGSVLVFTEEVFPWVEQGMAVGLKVERVTDTDSFSDVMYFDTPALALEALQAGEIDCVIGQATPLNYLVKSSGNES
ncbi:serine/threonine-protein kinase [Bariatricus sp. SGI.154]|uniref:serine/threonine-protein kinase n=1 Tax=Bariatricus sp. SGI.154 TaxID=3420549 RepID=UPI003D0188A6